MFGLELVSLLGGKSEEGGCFSGGDVLEVGQLFGYGTNPQGESRLLVEAEGMTNDAQGCSDGAEGWIGGIVRERDSLTILFVLLRPPADANRSDGCGERVGDIWNGDVTIPEEFEIIRDEGFQ